MSASIHDKLNRVRKPRVHITYEVETEGAEILRELPFVVGVMGDFSGDPDPAAAAAGGSQVHPDRPRQLQRRHGPHDPGPEAARSTTSCSDDGSEMAVDLKFNSIEDFEPARVAQQVPALRALLETRDKLRDLMSKVDRSEELEGLLEQVLQNEDELKSLSSQLGLDKKEG